LFVTDIYIIIVELLSIRLYKIHYNFIANIITRWARIRALQKCHWRASHPENNCHNNWG